MAEIHPTAILDPSAEVASTAKIGPYCVIGPEVKIGEGTVLLDHVTVQRLTTIGQDNLFYPYSVVGADPQDRKFHGERTLLTIGDGNQIREHVTLHRGTGNGGGCTRIGSHNLIMVGSHVAHDCTLGDFITIANQVMLAGHVHVENGASIGGGAGVHHFTTVGAYSFVGGLARIAKDVPPFMIVEGNPAEVRAINVIGMTRHGFSADEVEAMKEAFRRLYRTNASAMSEKLEDLAADFPDVHAVQLLVDHLSRSADGVHGRALETARLDNKRTVVAGSPQ